MSLIVTGDRTLFGIGGVNKQDYYFSTYYALTGSNVFIQYKNPLALNSNQNLSLSGYLTDFGDGSPFAFTGFENPVPHKYLFEGTYYISYSAIYIKPSAANPFENKIKASVANFTDIILDETKKTTKKTTPNGIISGTSYQNAANRIFANKSKLQQQIVNFVKIRYPDVIPTPELSAKCFRDVGYIVDGLAADILNNANHRSIDVGDSYYKGAVLGPAITNSPVPTLPLNQVESTIAAISALVFYINGDDIPIDVPSFTSTGVLSSINAGSERKQDVIARINNVIYPLSNNGQLNAYAPLGSPSSEDILFADYLIQQKPQIQQYMAQYVQSKGYINNPNPTVNQTLKDKCNRDIGFMVDAIAHDLKTGVTSKSIQYALAYWDGSTSRLPDSSIFNQKQKTVDTLNELQNYILGLYQTDENKIIFSYYTDTPFIIKNNWDVYNPLNIRLSEEIDLNLPYVFEEIEIQPNEWGVSDIFNTSISRLQDCLNYLIAKTKTINTFSPTLYFGWLGNNTGTRASRLKWFTKSYNFSYVNNPEIAKNTGASYFSKVTDCIEKNTEVGSFLYVLDDKKIDLYNNLAVPEKFIYTNGDQLSSFLIEPSSMALDETGTILYVSDKISNIVYKMQFTASPSTSGVNVNLQLFTGGFGGMLDNNNFNTPTQIFYKNEQLYVLDYNNFCVKKYNKDLNWLYTYYIEDFSTNRPISIASLKNGLLYVLTENYKVYIFDTNSSTVFESFDVSDAEDDSKLIKIIFDEDENFIYILTKENLYKYTVSGVYVTTVILPKNGLIYNNITCANNGILLIATDKCILKVQDILQVYELSEGLAYDYWDKNQLYVDEKELVTDLAYNRSLKRFSQNIITFSKNLNARFIIVTENVNSRIVTYFSYLPIDIDSEKPNINENTFIDLGIAINELHIPTIFNREFKKLYNALLQLADFLSIKNYSVTNLECIRKFCWSWEATSCYELKLPVIKTCSINPISYLETIVDINRGTNYVPVEFDTDPVTWEKAKSKCCIKKG